ncbi:GerAB/ArcD/ProY family transporter [Paenibacillus sp. 1P07SE]|uniref:GerAB/ArcD/ProY family transporter n=1 Tax=Paenibacillus sp. 1P07SE TaxID=3132209 RepID=UPI0039A60F2B
MEKNKIGGLQFFIMTFGLSVGTSILVTPSGLVMTAREDAWVAALFSMLVNLAMVWLYIRISRAFPGQSLFQILIITLGRWLGTAVSMLYLFYFLMLSGTLLGNLGFFFTSELMPETPFQAIEIIFLITTVMCARLGIIVLARAVELMFPWIIFIAMVLIFTLFPQVEWQYILPFWEGGALPVLKAGWHAAMFQELAVMLVFMPMVSNAKTIEKAYVMGALTGGLLLAITVLLSLLILGIEQSANHTFPAYSLAKTINIGGFLQRIEVLLITMWVLTFFIKTSLMFFGILNGLQTVFGLKSYRPLIYPIAVINLYVSWNTYINSVYVAEVIQDVWAGYSSLHLILIPLLVWLVGSFRRKRNGTGSQADKPENTPQAAPPPTN